MSIIFDSLFIFVSKYFKWLLLIVLLGLVYHFISNVYTSQLELYDHKIQEMTSKIDEVSEINNKNMKEIEKLQSVMKITEASIKETNKIRDESTNNNEIMVEENLSIPTAPIVTPQLIKSIKKLDVLTSKSIEELGDL